MGVTIRWAPLLLAGALALSACSTKEVQQAPPPAEAPVQQPEQKPEPQKGLAVTAADGVMERSTFAKGEQLPGPGLYFMETASGQMEGWKLKADKESWVNYQVSPDNRWILARADRKSYLTDRTTGKTYTWNEGQFALPALSSRGLLFTEGSTYHWVSPEISIRTSFSAPIGTVVLAPNADLAAIVPSTSAQNAGRSLFYLADLKSGQVRPVGQVPTAPPGTAVRETRMTAIKGGQELVLATSLFAMKEKAGSQFSTHVERFNWDGKSLGATDLPGDTPVLSSDGKLIAWEQMLGGVIPTVRVADAETGKERFRILGAAGPIWESPVWLAGNDRFMIGTQEGPVFVSNEGKLTKTGLAGARHKAFGQIVPAPDDANLFTNAQWFIAGETGPSLLDGEGRVLQQVKIPKGNWRFTGPTWGETSKELRFSFMVEPGGDGWDGVLIAFPAKVEFPPYKDDFVLQVKDPKQECLNLRAGHNRESKVIRCLPQGTKLALADPTGTEQHWNLPALYDDSMQWAYVQTEAGEKGWVSVSAGALTWTD